MEKKTYKSIIQKYVVLKINSGQWKSEKKIPSENEIAKKFHCSRLTARESLQSLVNSGILYSKRGSGYIVSGDNKESYLRSFALSHNVIKTEIEKLENVSWIKNFFKTKSERAIYVSKKYYDKNGLLAIQYTILNKSIIWEENIKEIKASITKYLAKNGVAIKYSNISIKTFSNQYPELKKYAQKIGWNSSYFPAEVVRSYSQEGWVEKTIRITRPDSLIVDFTKRTYI